MITGILTMIPDKVMWLVKSDIAEIVTKGTGETLISCMQSRLAHG